VTAEPKFPPKIQTDFARLCAGDGPAEVNRAVSLQTLEWAAGEFPFFRIWPTFREWEPDEYEARRLWPWVALAAAQYRFERTVKRDYPSEPTPTAVKELLASISANAIGLLKDLNRLHELANRLDDAEAPTRRAHLRWLYANIEQNLIPLPGSPELARPWIDGAPETELAAHFAMRHFSYALLRIGAAADAMADAASISMLTRKTVGRDRGLAHLVAHGATIWQHMTGKVPSVNKVRSRHVDKPPFARFISKVAKEADGQEPTLKQIATAYGA
jgi:hypothetical protein